MNYNNDAAAWSLQVDGEAAMMELGRFLARIVMPGDVLYISGQLGAGKTTLVRGIARAMGYKGRVTSPTFTLMNVYPHSPVIYHLDFYRLETPEIDDLGLEDILEKEGICFIEWPVTISGLLPEEAFYIQIELQDGDYDLARLVEVRASGEFYLQRLKELKNHADSGD